MQYGVIMAGGAGTRLWPLSRSDRPKQLLPVVRGRSLLQLSYDRLRGILPPDRIFVCTGAAHGQAVRTGFEVVSNQPSSLVAFGLVPTFGHTGLGYIPRGEPLGSRGGSGDVPIAGGAAYRVLSFKE